MSRISTNLQLVNVSYIRKNGHPNRINFFRDPLTGDRYHINSSRKAITAIKMYEIKHIEADVVDDGSGIGVLSNPWVSDPVGVTTSETNYQLDI